MRRLPLFRSLASMMAVVAVAVPALAGAAPATTPAALQRVDRTAASTAIPPAVLAKLKGDVSAWRRSHPRSFELVASVKGCSADTWQSFRRPEPTCTRELRALGAGVALPLWSALLLEAPRTASGQQPYAADNERAAYAAAALDALGTFRLKDNGPLLRALFPVVEANLADEAAAALGRTSTVEAPADAEVSLALLAQWARSGSDREGAAIAGLGQSRGLAGARMLISLLEGAASQPKRAEAAAWALGQNASSWAWQARARTKSAAAAEAPVVQREAAAALLQAYVRHKEPAVREAAMKGLMLAAHPDSLAMVDQAKAGADAETRAALDNLHMRLRRYFARNAASLR